MMAIVDAKKEAAKKKKKNLKRARLEKRAEKARKKQKSTVRAESSWFRTEPFNPDEGKLPETTNFNLPLYNPLAVEGGFVKFSKKILSNGLQDKTSRITEAAILTTHATNILFCAAHEEAKMLADKEKYHVLVQAHERRAKECEEKIAKMELVEAELLEKAGRYETMVPVFEERAVALCKERSLKELAFEKCQSAQIELAVVQAKFASERRELKAQTSELAAEMEEAKGRAAQHEKDLEEAKRQAVEDYKASAELKNQELLWKQEAYYEGVDTNFLIFTHYKVLDLPKYIAASQDPDAQASAPKETYSEQWAHLEEGGEE